MEKENITKQNVDELMSWQNSEENKYEETLYKNDKKNNIPNIILMIIPILSFIILIGCSILTPFLRTEDKIQIVNNQIPPKISFDEKYNEGRKDFHDFVKEYISKKNSLTEAQFEDFEESLKGKFITWAGNVENVDTMDIDPDWYLIYLNGGEDSKIHFSTLNAELAKSLNKGDKIIVDGEVDELFIDIWNLENVKATVDK